MRVKPMELPTLQEAWDAAIAALPPLSVCHCGYKHSESKDYGHEFSPNSLDGWCIEAFRYPQPSTFLMHDPENRKTIDDRGNQWHISAQPAADSHPSNRIVVRAPDQIRGLVRLTELLDKVIILNPYGWSIPINEDYCRDMYEEE